MDREQIKSERIVERYLSGDLTVRAAREFEQFCREHPEVLESLPIPARIKSQLTTRAFDGMGTSVLTARGANDELADIAAVTGLKVVKPDSSPKQEEDDEDAPAANRFAKPLLIALLVALLCAGGLFWQTQVQQKQIRSLGVAAKSLKLRAAGEIRVIKILPAAVQTDNPQVSVSLADAQWLDIQLDVTTSRFKSFILTMEKADEDVRIVQMRRLGADTNKAVRFALNSAAFTAGDYEIKMEGLDYRGQPHVEGWVLIRMQ